MEPVNEQLLERIDNYIEDLFIADDRALAENLRDADEAGLPPIQVSANQGKLLYLILRMARARRVLEIGTLGGYSTTWIARAVPADGRVISLELSSRHAEVARRSLDRAGVGPVVEIRVGPAAGSLQELIRAGAAPFDAIFIDADKTGYVEYLDLALQLSHSGTVILADNLIRNGRVLEDNPPDANAAGAKAYNELIARDPRLESILLPVLKGKVDGLSISIVK
jgi:predicted O-methyltransferase YrrM